MGSGQVTAVVYNIVPILAKPVHVNYELDPVCTTSQQSNFCCC